MSESVGQKETSAQGQRRVRLWRLGIVALTLGFWELLGSFSKDVAFLIATPSAVAVAFFNLIWRDAFVADLLVTGLEATVGLLLGTIFGSALGLSLWLSLSVAAIARPFIFALGNLPILALAPLMIVWFGVGVEMKIAFAALTTLFVAFNQAYRGAGLVSGQLVAVMTGMGATRVQMFTKIIVPGSLDWVLGSIRLNVGFSLLGAFVGEFVASDRGVGHIIIRAAGLYDVPRSLAGTIGIVVLASGLDSLAARLESRRHVLVQWLSVPRVLWKTEKKRVFKA